MAGDNVTASVQYYYQSSTASDNPNFISNLLSSLVQAIAGSSASSIVKDNATNISNQLNLNSVFASDVKPAGSGGTTPKAWLTILFFDERFNFISAADGGVAQQQVASSVGSSGASLGALTIKAPKNGYVYVYVSNRSDQNVYFDNLNVAIAAGNIIEENHYYAYGLKISAISSKKLGDSYEGTLDNKYLYNDKELFDDADLNWYDYGFRNYDPQIGRFTQLDPLIFDYPFYTPYQFSGDEPISNVDIDGLEPQNVLSFISRITKNGGSVNSVRLLSTGKHAGQWVVGYGLNGIGHSAVFAAKAVGSGSILGARMTIGFSQIWNSIKGFGEKMIDKASWNLAGARDWITDTWNQAGKNARANWNAGNDPFHQMIANPMSMIGGPEAMELNAAERTLANELRLTESTEHILGNEVKQIERIKAQTSNKLVQHHSDPKFLGGDPKQKTTTILENEHHALHKDLNDFLVKYKDSEGNHMRPQRGNSGRIIQANFTREERLKATAEFYKGMGAKYREAAVDFFKQHPDLK